MSTSPADPTPKPTRLAPRRRPAPAISATLREARAAAGLSLTELAQRCGLAASTLSKIENGQMSPTYEALKKLAEGLAISVPQLFTPPSRTQVNGRMMLTRAGDGQRHPTATYEHELLAPGLARKKMMPYRARIRARDDRVRRLGAP